MNQKIRTMKRRPFRKGKFDGRRSGGGYSNNRSNDAGGSFDVRAVKRAEMMRDKYLTMARESLSGGDRVQAENCYQHADHYLRLINEAEAQGITSSYRNNSENNRSQEVVLREPDNLSAPTNFDPGVPDASEVPDANNIGNISFLRPSPVSQTGQQNLNSPVPPQPGEEY